MSCCPRRAAHPWQIGPSIHQVPVQHFTHQRKLPLATTLDVNLGAGGASCAHYLGHGKSKIVYVLKTANKKNALSGNILKLTKDVDPEPKTFSGAGLDGLIP